MGKSLAEQVASLPERERVEFLASLRDVDHEQLLWDWGFWSRPEQRAPDGEDWGVWLYMAGRGAGKTRSAAEWLREKAKRQDRELRFGLVARTASDVRDVLVEGESGILSISSPSEMPEYQPSKRKLTWPNGHTALCYTADEPDQLRGPQFDYSWADEAAAWRQMADLSGMTAWDNLRVATRLGVHPQICVTTTPKRVKLMQDLLREAEDKGTVVVTKGRTADNLGNLSGSYLEGIYGVYDGTRMARQELDGEMLDDVEGALWDQEMIDNHRQEAALLGLPLRCVGVDPTVAERPGDECGIVVCMATSEREMYQRQAWVLEDASILGSPEQWARKVVNTARKWAAPVVAEVNQGGTLVTNAIRSIDPTIPIFEVHSKYGKQLRAEPIVLAYEQGRVHHVGTLAELELQQTTWVPGEGRSPDRVDALVHALTALIIRPPSGLGGGPIRAKSAAARRITGNTGGSRRRAARVLSPGVGGRQTR